MSRPFDEARYRGLLEGLEVVEIPLSHTVAKERIDSEGFGKTEAHFLAILSRQSCKELVTLAEVSDGNHLSIAEDFSVESGVRYLRGQDISSDMMLDDKNAVYIPDSEYAKLARSHIFTGDVLLTIVGANTGQTALVDEAPSKLTANCKLGIIRARPKSGVLPECLHAFLAGRYGQFQVQQSKRGGGQTGLILPDLKALLIPRFNVEFEQAIVALSQQGHKAKRESRAIFESAEQTLLGALGLESWQPPEPLTYTRPSRDAFSAGRLDAEYFAPRVAELLNHLNKDGLNLGSVAPARHERFVVGKSGSFEYIEIGGVRADGTVVSESVPQLEAPSRATWLVKSGDVITSTVRPIRRLSAFIAPEQDGHVCSSGFVVLQPISIPAEVLLTYLRLPPVCELLDLHTSASLYPAISEPDLLAMPIPQIDAAAQTRVVECVRAAQASRRRAAELLNAAKRAVEIAIESDEAIALEFLNREITPQ